MQRDQVPETDKLPAPNTYWVMHGRLAAGGYPLNPSRDTDRKRLENFIDCGFLDFIDLTEPGELDEYLPLLENIAAQRGLEISHARFPIEDRGLPSSSLINHLVTHLNNCLSNNRRVYVHCMAGIGRTGIAAGCYLAASDEIDTPNVIETLKVLRSGIEKFERFPVSPSLATQRAFLLKWVKMHKASRDNG